MKSARCVVSLGILLAIATGPARATWSIIVARTSTGEVGIASATCLPNDDLKAGAGVLVVGFGAGQAQAQGDPGQNRMRMFDKLREGLDAEAVLDFVKRNDPSLPQHQYGVATLAGPVHAATFSGGATSQFSGGVTGTAGDIHYAIQGNILTCADVVLAAEEALRSAPGDLAQKLMAAMEAARSFGGDGRCSCSQLDPQCGCPPASFQRSAFVGYLTIARIGDLDGVCNPAVGCANGTYYLDLNITGGSRDPVVRLRRQLNLFRESWAGHADHIRTRKVVNPERILADGRSAALLEIALVDLDGMPVAGGGAAVSVAHDATSTGATTIGPVLDHGDGSYSVVLAAGRRSGTDVFRVVVDDGKGPVTLYPFPTLEVVAPSLLAEPDSVRSGPGEAVDLRLTGGPSLAGASYLILGSVSGTSPGFDVGGVHVPLNPDAFTRLLLGRILTPSFTGGIGKLDARGEAAATFDPLPLELAPIVGLDMSFAWVRLDPIDFASNAASVRVKD